MTFGKLFLFLMAVGSCRFLSDDTRSEFPAAKTNGGLY
jgi:hypothetical protein